MLLVLAALLLMALACRGGPLDAGQRRWQRAMQACVHRWRLPSEDLSAEEQQGESVLRAAACAAWLVGRGRPAGALAVELYSDVGLLTRALAMGFSRDWRSSVSTAQDRRGPAGPCVVSFDERRHPLELLLPRLRRFHGGQLPAEPVADLPERILQTVNRGGGAGNVSVVLVRGDAYPHELCQESCARPAGMYWTREARTCLKCPLPRPGESALREVCERWLGSSGRLDLVVLYTGSPALEEWFLMERYCMPRHVFLVGGNLPLHPGWVLDRLLLQPNSTWRVVHEGLTEWSQAPWPGMFELMRRSSYHFLVDLSST